MGPDSSRLVGLRVYNPREGKTTSLLSKGLPCLGFERELPYPIIRGSSGRQGEKKLPRQNSNDSIFRRSVWGFHGAGAQRHGQASSWGWALWSARLELSGQEATKRALG